jgi:hypothetical protein
VCRPADGRRNHLDLLLTLSAALDRRWQYRRRMTVLYSLFALRKDSGRPGLRHILSARNECIIKRERIKCG